MGGEHYQRTARAWLANFDRYADRARPLLAATYGPDLAQRWFSYWRVFFMACAELWGYRGGTEWQVSHYLYRNTSLQCDPGTIVGVRPRLDLPRLQTE